MTGVAINVGVYGSTEEMEAKIRAGNSGIDVVVPSNYAIEGWVANSLIEPLDYSKLPDFVVGDWNARFMNQAFDQGNKYSIPKNWGTTGIAYRSSKVTEDVTSWSQFFEVAGTTYEGKTLIVDHQISSFGSAAVAMGYSLNTIDATEMAAVEAMLIALKPKLFAISSDVQPPLRALDTWLSIAWTGDGVRLAGTRKTPLCRRGGRWRALDRQLHGGGRRAPQGSLIRVPELHHPARAGRRGDGILPLPARERQGDRAPDRRGQEQRGDLSERRLPGQAGVRRQRHLQQRGTGRGLGPHQGVCLTS